MFTISVRESGDVVLSGRFDAAQVEAANTVLDKLNRTTRVDFGDLDYISSAGLGALLKTQKRLTSSGQNLILTNMNKMVRDVFRMARFDVIFRIEEGV